MPINKCLVPNLRRLKMNWVREINLKSIGMLFGDDVLFSLTKFALLAKMTELDVLHNVLSKLSNQCSYRFDVTWNLKEDGMALSDTNNILSKTFQQLKGSMPIELQLSSTGNDHSMRAMTLPRMDSCFSVRLFEDTVCRWASNEHVLSSRWFHCNEIRMIIDYDQKIDEYLSLSPSMICWDRITSISVHQPFTSSHLRVLLSNMINLRILTLTYICNQFNSEFFKNKTQIDVINDESLCKVLTSNGLRQLNLVTHMNQSNLTNLGYRTIERLPYLEVIEMIGWLGQIEVIEMASILINGHPKLSFVALSSWARGHSIFNWRTHLFNSITRPFRTEKSCEGTYGDTLLIWL